MSNNAGWTQSESFDNWDDVSTEAPAPLAPGMYVATIVKADSKPTAKQGLPSVNLELSVTDVFQGDKLERPRKIFDNITVVKESQFRVKGMCQSADRPYPKGNGADYLPTWAADLVGATVIVKTKLETYNGKTNARVEKYHTQASAEKALGGGSAAEASEAEATNGAAPKRQRRGATAQA